MPYDSICTAPSAIDNSVGTITYSGSSSTTAIGSDTYTSSYVSYEPYTTSAGYTLALGPTSEEVEKKIKDASDKIDQHVDALEQDIDFLNQRQEYNINNIDILTEENNKLKEHIKYLESTIDTLNVHLKELNNKYDDIYTKMSFYNIRITHLEKQTYEMD